MDLALLCTHNPIVLACKITFYPNKNPCWTKKHISLLLRSKKSMFWHFLETRIKR